MSRPSSLHSLSGSTTSPAKTPLQLLSDKLARLDPRRQAGVLLDAVHDELLTPRQALNRWPMGPETSVADPSLDAAYQLLWHLEADETNQQQDAFYLDAQLTLLKQVADCLMQGQALPKHILALYTAGSPVRFYYDRSGYVMLPWDTAQMALQDCAKQLLGLLGYFQQAWQQVRPSFELLMPALSASSPSAAAKGEPPLRAEDEGTAAKAATAGTRTLSQPNPVAVSPIAVKPVAGWPSGASQRLGQNVGNSMGQRASQPAGQPAAGVPLPRPLAIPQKPLPTVKAGLNTKASGGIKPLTLPGGQTQAALFLTTANSLRPSGTPFLFSPPVGLPLNRPNPGRPVPNPS
ncbi:MAG: hypothetical protein SFZ03_09325 [Candidatus Melainabacteria bacterium]|nr:hypothetical protein [Candidatus Melainabacteria bacterium]